MSEGLLLVSATGNRFALFDGLDGAQLADPGTLAHELGHRGELGLDGLLELLPAREDGDCRMVLHNMDGSRAEACGNGLRCVAAHVLMRKYVDGPRVVVETDAGPRPVEVLGLGGGATGATRARASMGEIRIEELTASLPLPPECAERYGSRVTAAIVDAGNPHCVLFVDDAGLAPVEVLGPVLENHERFPHRTNVEFVALEPGRLRVRIWERGVGETRSCGTGVTAAACVAVARSRAAFPVRVDTAGGSLVVLQERGEVFLEGEVEIESRRYLRIDSSWLAGSPPGATVPGHGIRR